VATSNTLPAEIARNFWAILHALDDANPSGKSSTSHLLSLLLSGALLHAGMVCLPPGSWNFILVPAGFRQGNSSFLYHAMLAGERKLTLQQRLF
jgi:hypothetical protein